VVTSRDIVLVAPHPDDEVFGCAGLIALNRQAGGKVTCLMLTDGRSSHRGCCDTSSHQIAKERVELADVAGEKIGLKPKDFIWLGLPDGDIPFSKTPRGEDAVDLISKYISKLNPSEVYAPVPFDCWPDHARAFDLAQSAIDKLDTFKPALIGYSVWMWHNLRLRDLWQLKGWERLSLDIKSVQSKKLQAMDCYMSAINPACGKPVCGDLPKGFLGHFKQGYEIFFRKKESNE